MAKDEITLKDLMNMLIQMDNKLTAMNSYYAKALSKTIKEKDKAKEEAQKEKDEWMNKHDGNKTKIKKFK